MKPLKPGKKLVLAAVGFFFALLIIKITLFFTAKPKVTVDYLAEYNRITRPEDYDPNENAAPYYQKAFDAFVEMPRDLRNPYVNWPTDFNNTEQALLEEWLTSNSQPFEYLKVAADMPYYWLERHTEEKHDNIMLSMMLPELSPFRDLIRAVLWDAKLKAIKGQFQSSFENVLDCYKASQHKCRPNLLLMSQYNGINFKKETINNAFVILDRLEVDNKALKFLQKKLRVEFDNDTYVPDFIAEKLFLYDALQRTFIDNGKGTGRWAWSVGFYISTCSELDKSDFRIHLDYLKRRLYCCLRGATRNEITEQTEKVLSISKQIMPKTPWQIKNGRYDYFAEIEKINNSNSFLQILNINPKKTFHLYYKTKVQTEALITTIAILRYKTDTGRFPESLEKLVSTGYLKSVPMDPYSDGPLVYQLIEDNFVLYSVGEDFKDDGGITSDTYMSTSKWPSTSPNEFFKDIVFWPVKWLEDPLKNFDKLKAEREKLNLRRR